MLTTRITRSFGLVFLLVFLAAILSALLGCVRTEPGAARREHLVVLTPRGDTLTNRVAHACIIYDGRALLFSEDGTEVLTQSIPRDGTATCLRER